MSKIKVTQIKSKINCSGRQRRTLEALGLKRIGHSVVHENTDQIIGMTKKVHHLINVENVE